MKVFLAFTTLLMIPIGFLDLFGGIIGGIWLAILGEWRIILQGLFFLIVGGLSMGWFMLPAMLIFGMPAIYFLTHKKICIARLCVLLDGLYTGALITVWCVGITLVFLKNATTSSTIPLLLWSYGVATGPWAYLTFRDQYKQVGGNEFSTITFFFTELAYIIMAIYILFSQATILSVFIVFGSVMLISVIIETYVAISSESSKLGYA